MALATGCLNQGALEVPAQVEVELDLFWQQAILPAIHNILLVAAQVLQRTHLPERAAWLELYLSGELGSFLERAAQQGLANTLVEMPLTGQYGTLSRTERFQESKLAQQMDTILQSIQSGDFAREWPANMPMVTRASASSISATRTVPSGRQNSACYPPRATHPTNRDAPLRRPCATQRTPRLPLPVHGPRGHARLLLGGSPPLLGDFSRDGHSRSGDGESQPAQQPRGHHQPGAQRYRRHGAGTRGHALW
ncbi:MAG: hypothetical protein HC915_04985 [Anaerolineae bacterium]|nr:hypothetical protein [Anaerolineae bacterium]